MKILIHGTVVGYGGISHHTRKLSEYLNKNHEVKIRNFNVPKNFKGYSGKDILSKEPLLSNHKNILFQQTLFNNEGNLEDFMLTGYDPNFIPDVNIIMAEVEHYYYYQDYGGLKIAYFPHETDKINEGFLNRLNYFDEVWVPSLWQKEILINQNFNQDKIKVINIGVDPIDFNPSLRNGKDDKIKILHIGTFEYRKSSYEIIKSFINNFRDNPNVELRLSINNKLRQQDAFDEFKKYGLEELNNIKFLNTLSDKEYKNEIINSDIYLSCARGEGWNIPLMESMACGVPSIYSKCGGQLEFANENHHTGIDIIDLLPSNFKQEVNGHTWWWYFGEHFTGNLYEPDFNQLDVKLKHVVDNIQEYKYKALEYSKHIIDNFNWDKIAENVSESLQKSLTTTQQKSHSPNNHSKIFYRIHSQSFGDTLAATPTLRYLHESHREKINVVSHNHSVFKNNPHVEKLLTFQEFNDLDKNDIVLYESFTHAGTQDKNGIEKKFSHLDIRQVHAFDLGFQLLPNQMSYDFYPDELNLDINLPKDYVVLHVTTNWANRTWDYQKWKTLIEWLRLNNIFTVLIGSGYREELHKSFSDKPLDKDCPNFDNLYGIDLTNKGTMSDMWWVINGAKCIVTMDTGPLHLAGTTDTHILQLGSAIDPYLRSPYRNGSQNYKYEYIGGTCKIHCNSNLKYYVNVWGHINAVPPLPGCMENKEKFECHPYPNQVIDKINEIIFN